MFKFNLVRLLLFFGKYYQAERIAWGNSDLLLYIGLHKAYKELKQ